MKFTLTPNDDLKFKIVSYSNITADEILIKNSRVYNNFDYWQHQRKELDSDNCRFDNIWITIYKGIGKIAYRLEDMQLISRGNGNKSKIYKIEVNANESSRKAKIKIFTENTYSSVERLQQVVSFVFENCIIWIDKTKRQIDKKKKKDNRTIKNIIKEKSKKTITDEY